MTINSIIEELGLAIVILVVCFAFAAVFNRLFHRFMDNKAQRTNYNPTNYKFLRHTLSAVIYLVGFGLAIYTIPALKSIATSILAGAGIMAVAIGFASQAALSNIISGLFIVIYKPFGVNDRIDVNNLAGIVEDITLRHTVIRNFENQRIIIPNSIISAEVIVNSDLIDERICKHIVMGISYESDIDKARSIIQEEALKHPFCIDARQAEEMETNPDQVAVRVVEWAESSIHLKAWVWANNMGEGFQMKCDLLESIKKRFDKEGISIPYPHRTIVQKSKP